MAAGKKAKRRITWSGGQAIEIPRKTAWEITPLRPDEAIDILNDTRREKRASATNHDLDTALADEHRRAMAERWRRQSGTTVKPRKRLALRVVLPLSVLVAVLGGVTAAALYVEGPWTPYVSRIVNLLGL